MSRLLAAIVTVGILEVRTTLPQIGQESTVDSRLLRRVRRHVRGVQILKPEGDSYCHINVKHIKHCRIG